MKVKYFSDTDTALLEFNNRVVSETKEIGINVYLDLDKNGDIVSMTIEHAKENAGLNEFSFIELKSKSA